MLLIATIAGECSWTDIIWTTSNCHWCSVGNISCYMPGAQFPWKRFALGYDNRWSNFSRIFKTTTHIICYHHSSNPSELWDKYKDDMAEDILCWVCAHSENPHLKINEEMHNQALVLIENMSYFMWGILLVRLGIPSQNKGINDAFQRELQRESEYVTNALSQLVRTNVPGLNPQLKEV